MKKQVVVWGERLVRDRFEDKGRILVRFGNAPKRCIPFQTIEPFPKLLRLFGDADTPAKDCGQPGAPAALIDQRALRLRKVDHPRRAPRAI